MSEEPEPGQFVALERIEGPQTIIELLRAAVDKGTAVETLEKLVALHERVTDRQAAMEMAEAMAASLQDSACRLLDRMIGCR